MKQAITFLTLLFMTFSNMNPLLAQIQMGADIDGLNAGDETGRSVAFSNDGNRLAVGAPTNFENDTTSGQIRVYDWDGTGWVQVGQSINGEALGDEAGRSVVLSANGNRLAFGARSNDGNGQESGHVRVYDFVAGAWVQVGDDIDGTGAGDVSGSSISLSSSGNRLAIGAPLNDSPVTNAGQVRIYDWDGVTWTQAGQAINGENLSDHFGEIVSLSSDGNRVASGARFYDGNSNNVGYVRIYDWDGAAWTQVGTDILGEAADDRSSRSISLSSDGNRVAIGADYNDGNGDDAGHVRIYDWDGTTWTQLGADIDGEADGDRFGFSVSLSSNGNRMAIGSSHHEESQGQVKIYDWDGANWNQFANVIEGEALGDRSGRSVVLSADGSRVAIGAPRNDGNGNDAGHVRVFELSTVSAIDRSEQYIINVFPNPTTGKIEIIGNEKGRIRIIDASGRIVLESAKAETELDISEIPDGIYFIQIELKKQSIIKKIIKN